MVHLVIQPLFADLLEVPPFSEVELLAFVFFVVLLLVVVLSECCEVK